MGASSPMPSRGDIVRTQDGLAECRCCKGGMAVVVSVSGYRCLYLADAVSPATTDEAREFRNQCRLAPSSPAVGVTTNPLVARMLGLPCVERPV